MTPGGVRTGVSIATGLLSLVTLNGCDMWHPENKRTEEAKDAVGLLLADPASAQYTDIAVKDNVVCGLVNSKNLVGAYSGFTGFIVADGSAELGDDGAEFFNAFLKKCGDPAKSKFMALDIARTKQRVDAITDALKDTDAPNR